MRISYPKSNLNFIPLCGSKDVNMKGFTLHNVKKSLCKQQVVNNNIKLAPRVEKRRGGRITARETNEGYIINIANTCCANFEEEVKNECQTCFQDHHPYDGPKVTIPYKHERIFHRNGSITHKFIGPGSFCDIFCLWTYLCEEAKKIPALRDHRLDTAIQNTKVAFALMFPPNVVLKERPHWQTLQTYGGHLTIESYRNGTYTKTFIKTPEVIFDSSVVVFFTQ